MSISSLLDELEIVLENQDEKVRKLHTKASDLMNERDSARHQIARAIAQLGGRIDPDRFDGNDAEIEHLDDLISSVRAQLRAYEDSVND